MLVDGAPPVNMSNSNITCNQGYYLSDSSTCRPLCSLWVEPVDIASDYIAVIVTVVIGLLSSTVLIVLAITVQRNTM